MRGRFVGHGLLAVGALVTVVAPGPRAEAGEKPFRWGVVAVPTACPVPTGTLGSGFVETPFLMVRGNGPIGGGYSPLNQYGNTSMSVYGPLSSLRTTSAPVLTYTRGYDGRTVVAPGTSFSTPNLPRLTPVVYPTQGTNYYGFRQSGTPPWWPNAINWLDQN